MTPAASFWDENMYYVVAGGAGLLALVLFVAVCVCCRRRRKRRRPGPARKRLKDAVHGFDAHAMAELGECGAASPGPRGGGRARAALLDQWAVAHVDGYQPPAGDISSLLRHLQDVDVFKRIDLGDLQVRYVSVFIPLSSLNPLSHLKFPPPLPDPFPFNTPPPLPPADHAEHWLGQLRRGSPRLVPGV
jgi:hypothetical protein